MAEISVYHPSAVRSRNQKIKRRPKTLARGPGISLVTGVSQEPQKVELPPCFFRAALVFSAVLILALNVLSLI